MTQIKKNPARARGGAGVTLGYTDTRTLSDGPGGTSDFSDVLRTAGFDLRREPVADGRIHRCHVKGDRSGTKNGWWIAFSSAEAVYLTYGSWKIGQAHKWSSAGAKRLPRTECAQVRREIAKAKAEREAERAKQHRRTQLEAAQLWESAPPARDHAYLRRKGVASYSLRLGPDGRLLMPLYDAAGTLWNVERIADDSTKRTLKGGRVQGLYGA